MRARETTAVPASRQSLGPTALPYWLMVVNELHPPNSPTVHRGALEILMPRMAWEHQGPQKLWIKIPDSTGAPAMWDGREYWLWFGDKLIRPRCTMENVGAALCGAMVMLVWGMDSGALGIRLRRLT